MNVKNRSALITGASRGLGKALARELLLRGARVVLVARGAEALKRSVHELRAETAGEVHGIAADIGDKRAPHRIAGETAALVGPVELLVHNASTVGPLPMRLLLDTECEDLERVLQVNLLGPFRLTKIIAGSMALRRQGLVLSVSSDAAVEHYETWGPYGLSKAALDHSSATLAAELADTGVRFLSVDPGEMNTKMHADALPDADPTTLADPGEVARRLLRIIEDSAVKSGSRLTADSFAPVKEVA